MSLPEPLALIAKDLFLSVGEDEVRGVGACVASLPEAEQLEHIHDYLMDILDEARENEAYARKMLALKMEHMKEVLFSIPL